MALDPAPSTSTTCAAVTPDGTRQRFTGAAGFGAAGFGAAVARRVERLAVGVAVRVAVAFGFGFGFGFGLVVLVEGSGSSAAVRACRRTSGGYTTELGPYYGHVGRNGVTYSKREGDMSTPAGVFALRGGFGAYADPGVRVGSWLRVDSRDVWVDDPASSLYNTHQRTPADGRWASAEKLLNQPAYNYAQVIGWNEARVPGKGSAIFFHVDKGAGTAGCVSIPTRGLLAVLRWERSGAVMAIR